MRFYKKNKPAKIQIKTKSIFVCLYIFSANSFFQKQIQKQNETNKFTFFVWKEILFKIFSKNKFKEKKIQIQLRN